MAAMRHEVWQCMPSGSCYGDPILSHDRDAAMTIPFHPFPTRITLLVRICVL